MASISRYQHALCVSYITHPEELPQYNTVKQMFEVVVAKTIGVAFQRHTNVNHTGTYHAEIK